MHLDQLPGSFFGPSTLVELLRHRAEHQGREDAFVYLVDGDTQEVRLSYRELDRRARALGAWLQAHKMSGQRALLLYPAGLDFIVAFFGCLYAGTVAVPAYPPRRNRSLSRIDSIGVDADAKIALTTEQVLDRVQGGLDDTPGLKGITWLATDQMPAGLESDWKMPDIHGDTLAFLQYTSGSTGTPKGVMLNHANLIHNSALIAYAFEYTRSGSGVFWLPSYHDMGLIGGILQPMYLGRPNVLMSPMSFLQKPSRWLRAITKYKATISGGPNFAYELCVDKLTPEEMQSLDLSTWSVAFNGAEPIRPETLDAFVKKFEPYGFRREAFYPCYGLAEATLIVSGGFKSVPPIVRSFDGEALEKNQVVDVVPDEESARLLVGCGGNLLDQEIVIVNPDTRRACAPDEIGEIWVSGPSVAQGYWKRDEESTYTFDAHLEDSGRGPFLRTGDMGFLQDGELFVTGRLKDLIIIRGRNHYPQDIELTVQRAHASLRGAGGVITIERDGRDRLVVVNEITRGPKRDPQELSQIYEAVRKAVSAEHDLNVEAIVLLKAGSIPKTSSGKIQRHACRHDYLHNELQVVAKWEAWAPQESAELLPSSAASGGVASSNGAATAVDDDIDPAVVTIVLDHVRAIGKERARDLSLDTNILELGMDSLERMEIVASLEDTFGARFPESVLPEMETCREVVEAVQKYLGRTPKKKSPSVVSSEIPEAHYRFELYPEYQAIKANQQMAKAAGLANPFFNVHQRVTADTTMIDGRELINWSSYNYIGMSGDPVVTKAAQDAVATYGTSVSASRLVSGEKPVHRELEQGIADFIGVDDAICFVGGHSTNETTIGHLFGPGDLVLHDSLAHNSIIQGCILSGARRRPFPHNDWQSVDQLLRESRGEYRRVLIAIEGVYSMDGDYPDLPSFIDVKKRHKAFLFVDEAHSAGTMGPTGRGIAEHFECDPRDVDLWMGTLSKTYGSCGGYIAGCHAVVEYLKYTAPGFVYSVGMPPSNAAAALASLNQLKREPQRVAQLAENSRLFLELAQAAGLDTGMSKDSPVVPVILGSSLNAIQLSQALFARGINVQPIMYPAVEEKAARLRFFITSKHTAEQIRTTVKAVTEELAKINPDYFQRSLQSARS